MLVAITYGKAFGLYGERVGMLFIVAPDIEVGRKVEKQMKLLARAETGAMPAFGAKIVEIILEDQRLRQVWEADVRGISEQLRGRRVALFEELKRLGTPGDWRFILEQVGMFS